MYTPILTFDEMTSVHTLDSLLELYRKKGKLYKDYTYFSERIRADWSSARAEIRNRCNTLQGFPKNVPSLKVSLDTTTYHLYGISHSHRNPLSYNALVWATVQAHDNWLFEHSLQEFFKCTGKGFEIPDKILNPDRYYFKEGFKSGVHFPRNMIANRKNAHRFNKARALPQVSTPKSEYFEIDLVWTYIKQNRQALGIKQDGLEDFLMQSAKNSNASHTLSLLYPLEYWSEDFPAYVHIQFQEKNKQVLNNNQKRSAYQAEFLRQWPVPGDKRILTGSAHSPEIKYFLVHGVSDPEIQDHVSKDIEFLLTAPDAYAQKTKHLADHKQKMYVTGCTVGMGVTLIGMELALLSGPAYLLLKYLLSK